MDITLSAIRRIATTVQVHPSKMDWPKIVQTCPLPSIISTFSTFREPSHPRTFQEEDRLSLPTGSWRKQSLKDRKSQAQTHTKKSRGAILSLKETSAMQKLTSIIIQISYRETATGSYCPVRCRTLALTSNLQIGIKLRRTREQIVLLLVTQLYRQLLAVVR